MVIVDNSFYGDCVDIEILVKYDSLLSDPSEMRHVVRPRGSAGLSFTPFEAGLRLSSIWSNAGFVP